MIHIGCCGMCIPIGRYSHYLDILEVQKSFYTPISDRTLKRWREKSGNLIFSIKAWQGITHNASSPTYRRYKGELKNPENYGFFQMTHEVEEAWKISVHMAEVLGAKFIILQSPVSFKPTEENIENVREFLKNHSFSGMIGWEPRGKWSDDVLEDIFHGTGAIHVVDPFVRMPVTDGIAYFRLHGSPPGKMYSYEYTKDDLRFILEAASNFEEAYILFNNYAMKKNVMELKEMV